MKKARGSWVAHHFRLYIVSYIMLFFIFHRVQDNVYIGRRIALACHSSTIGKGTHVVVRHSEEKNNTNVSETAGDAAVFVHIHPFLMIQRHLIIF